MTPNMKAFLTELADLMSRHDVYSLEAVGEIQDWQCSAIGIEVYIPGGAVGGDVPREFDVCLLPKLCSREDLRNAVCV